MRTVYINKTANEYTYIFKNADYRLHRYPLSLVRNQQQSSSNISEEFKYECLKRILRRMRYTSPF